MAWVTSGESGFTLESNRFTIVPSRPMRNLVKFQRMFPGNGELAPARYTYNGCRLSPFTSSLSNIGNVTSYFEVQNALISRSVPGSCSLNWLQGNPQMTSPLA